jgi:hypothetical protein
MQIYQWSWGYDLLSNDDIVGPYRLQPMDLYQLLPTLHKIKDSEQGYKLKAILDIISDQANIIYRDIGGLWDDFFIETCQPWVIPYIADLVGSTPLHQVAARGRADVAKTIQYRRRKGTLPMLEEMARDVTGWGAKAVSFFELLGWTQNWNHQRLEMAPNSDRRNPCSLKKVGTINLRDGESLSLLDGPFDIISHSIDVRLFDRPDAHQTRRNEGWYNLRNIGFFLWRLANFSISEVAPRQSPAHQHGYSFSPLGNPAPLFNHPKEGGVMGEANFPGPIRILSFSRNPGDFYGIERSLVISIDGQILNADAIAGQDLSTWARPPSTKKAAIDPFLGRITFAAGEEPGNNSLKVYYNYGFSASMGGGSYERKDTLADPKNAIDIIVCKSSPPGSNPCKASSLQEALSLASAIDSDIVITITDNATYEEANLSINLKDKRRITIQADNLKRPNLRLSGDLHVNGRPGAILTLNGLLIEGGIHLDKLVEKVHILHSTLVPGRSLDENGRPLEEDNTSIIVDGDNLSLILEIDHSILGPLRLPGVSKGLRLSDSIIEKGKARSLPALVSGILKPFPSLSSSSPSFSISIGCEGPKKIAFSAVPENLEDARKAFEDAIKAVSPSPAFARARVITVENRIVLIPGTKEEIELTESDDKNTIHELQLDKASRKANVFISGQISHPLAIKASNPSVSLSLGSEGSREINLKTRPILLVDAQDHLREGLKAEISSAFKDSLVGLLDDRLILLPGLPGVTASFGPSQLDPSTVKQLALEEDRPSIAQDDGGYRPGPPTVLERTTIFGSVFVKELTLASSVIFAERVMAERQQAGCVRFSYVPPGSQTPKRYRCQPDLAIDQEGGVSLAQEDKDLISERLKPSFTSMHYGDPAYAQLSLKCAEEIKTGAEDGSEMGAFSSLKQPQREANLRIRLDEYLPFGLNYGFIYVT